MVLILDGSSGIGAHVWSEICNMICLRPLPSLRTIANFNFKKIKIPFSRTCATFSELPSNIGTHDSNIRW